MNTDEKNLKTVVVPFESLGWGLLPSYRRWGFFRKWVRFLKDSQATVLEDIKIYRVRMYHEFYEEKFFKGEDSLPTSPIVKVEKAFRIKPTKNSISRLLDWVVWPKRQDGSLRFTTETGSVITVPFGTIMKGTIFNMRAALHGARDELAKEP